jgi:hypothetical protein
VVARYRFVAGRVRQPGHVIAHVEDPQGVGRRWQLGGSSLLHFADADDPSVAFVDTVNASLQRDNPHEVRRYIRFFEHLRTVALDPTATREVMTKRVEELT